MNAGDDAHILFLGAIIFAHGNAVGSGTERICVPCGAGEVSRRQRTLWHQGNLHLFADWDQFLFILAVEQIVVVLHGFKSRPAMVAGAQNCML